MTGFDIWNELGNIYFKVGAFDEAIDAYNKAIELDFRIGWLYSNLGFAYVHKGKFAEAISMYEKSIELLTEDKDKALSWSRMGDAYRELRQYDCAVQAYQKALELEPQDVAYSAGLSAALQEMERPEQEPVAEIAQAAPETELQPADDLYEEDEPVLEQLEPDDDVPVEAAAEAFYRIFEQDGIPEPLYTVDVPALVEAVSDAQGSPESAGPDAAGEVEQIVMDLPGVETEAVQAEASVVEQAMEFPAEPDQPGDMEDVESAAPAAEPWSAEPLEQDALTTATFNSLLSSGIESWRKGNPEKASEILQSALEAAGKAENRWLEALSYNALALVKTELGKLDEAIDSYIQAMQLAPEKIVPWNNIGNLYSRLDRNDDAMAAFLKAIEHNPEDFVGWDGLGDIYAKSGRLNDAIAAYQLGNVFGKQRRTEDALTAYQMILEPEPETVLERPEEMVWVPEVPEAVEAGLQSDATACVEESPREYVVDILPAADAPVVPDIEPAVLETAPEPVMEILAEPVDPAAAEPILAIMDPPQSQDVQVIEELAVEETVPAAPEAPGEVSSTLEAAAGEDAAQPVAASAAAVPEETAPVDLQAAAVPEETVLEESAPVVTEAEGEPPVLAEAVAVDEIAPAEDAEQSAPVVLPEAALEALDEPVLLAEAAAVDETAVLSEVVPAAPEAVAVDETVLSGEVVPDVALEAATSTVPQDDAPVEEIVSQESVAATPEAAVVDEAVVLSEVEPDAALEAATPAVSLDVVPVDEPAMEAAVLSAPEAPAEPDANVEAVAVDETVLLSEAAPQMIEMPPAGVDTGVEDSPVMRTPAEGFVEIQPDGQSLAVEAIGAAVAEETVQVVEEVVENTLQAPEAVVATTPVVEEIADRPAGEMDEVAACMVEMAEELVEMAEELVPVEDAAAADAQPVLEIDAPAEEMAVDEPAAQAQTGQSESSLESVSSSIELSRLASAVAAYKKVTEINPENDRAWDSLGNLYRASEHFGDAVSAFERAIALRPDKEVYHYHLGLVYAAEKHYEAAIGAFRKVIELNPDYTFAHCALAGYFRKLGMEAEAQQHIEIAQPKMAGEKEYDRACFAAICGNSDEAIELLKIALEKKQTSLDWVRRDPDLDFVREDPRFKTIVSHNGNWSERLSEVFTKQLTWSPNK